MGASSQVGDHHGPGHAIRGYCADGWGALHDELARNVEERGEQGAAVAVFAGGEPVVDLWTPGVAGRDRSWSADTLVCMVSTGKGLAAIAAHVLADRGLIDLDAAVADVWPSFDSADKRDISIRALLAHQAGLNFLDHLRPGSLLERDAVRAAIDRQSPEPGLKGQGAYHNATYGNLVDELVRQVTGQPLSEWFRIEVAGRFDIDFHFSVALGDDARVTPLLPNPANPLVNELFFSGRVPEDSPAIVRRMWHALPQRDGLFNSRSFRTAAFASANGHGNARAVARLYGLLAAPPSDGNQLLSPAAVARLTELQWDRVCPINGLRYREAAGVVLNTPEIWPMGANPRAFGSFGSGGAIGFADPDRGLSFAYSPSYMGEGAGLGQRCLALIEAFDRAAS